MKTLLRNTRSGLYSQGPDQWTDDPERAVDFRFIDRALTYIQAWHLKEVELAFVFEDDMSPITSVSVEKAALQCAARNLARRASSWVGVEEDLDQTMGSARFLGAR